ncbi:MAG: hypothetical protein K6B54_06885 [Clostridia bacterium]|nr:hypothetical protein [Clostridia bacterium]
MNDKTNKTVYDVIDEDGSIRKDNPLFRDAEKEMIRSHALCLSISAKKPTDPDYKGLLWMNLRATALTAACQSCRLSTATAAAGFSSAKTSP